MKIAVILGTRPEIIKMAPVIKELEKRGFEYLTIHTGQHYNFEMYEIFFKELKLPLPKYNLNIGSGTHGKQTGKMLEKIEEILIKEKPNIVLIEGDTNTVAAGALAAAKLNIEVGHVEAGLRSYDKSMPEELNRIIADHLADYLFAPTKISKKNLLKEGILDEKIYITGNTIVDAIYQNIKISKQEMNPHVFDYIGIDKEEYFLLTIHRQENVDKKDKLKKIIAGLELLSNEFEEQIIYPIHPRAMKKLKEFGLEYALKQVTNLYIISPISFLNFLQLEANAKLVLTDSGGVQEETCILKVPCVTLRENTERPETIEVGSNILVGTETRKILNGVKKMLNTKRNWKNPFGDGKAGEKIVNILKNKLGELK